jgi:hypothetical protein
LSFAYLLSCKPESISGLNHIKPEQRFDFWLNNFCNHFFDSINTFTPIIEACELFKGKLSNEDFEDYFWDIYPANQKPKDSCLPFVIQRESELLNEIEYTISEYKENEYWEFDFEKYQKFIDISKPIELLFNVSELLVQLNRLEMFNEILLPIQQTEAETKQQPTIALSDLITHKNSIKIVESIKVQYKNIKGKQLKLLLLALQDLNLLPKDRVAQKFYDCCKREFEWSIASYNAMNGYKFNELVDSKEFEEIKQYFETITKTK